MIMNKLVFLTVLLASTLQTTTAIWKRKTHHFNWEIGYVFWSPDCQQNMMIGINGQFPGPTIRAKAGDIIVVEVKNTLPTEGVVIHWHGIRQYGTPWSDGTASISQCPINPEETYVYRYTVDKPGTYFYHGHFGMQRSAGLYGSLIVDVADGEKEPFNYDGELNLLLSDWYHENVFSQMTGLSSSPFRWIGEPQSILINGRGQYGCSLAGGIQNGGSRKCDVANMTGTQCRPVMFLVEPKKTYRIRIASTTSLASLNMAIGEHKMTVVEADGNYVKPFRVTDLDIYSGESYSVLIATRKKRSSNFWINVGVRGRKPATPPAMAILNYKPSLDYKLPKSRPPVTPQWNDFARSKSFTYKLRARRGTLKNHALTVNRRIELLNTQNKMNGNYLKWAINNVSLVLPPTPYLGALKYGLKGTFDADSPPETFPKSYNVMAPAQNPNTTQSSNIYVLEFNRTVDVILQNANALAENVSEVHPWHLHGHDFWVLGYGDGKFRKEKDIPRFNLKNPPLKNTVVVFPYGWTAIRFIADNPGVWAFHCHIEPHLHMGMGVVVSEGIDLLGDVPKEALACGKTGTELMNTTFTSP